MHNHGVFFFFFFEGLGVSSAKHLPLFSNFDKKFRKDI